MCREISSFGSGVGENSGVQRGRDILPQDIAGLTEFGKHQCLGLCVAIRPRLESDLGCRRGACPVR